MIIGLIRIPFHRVPFSQQSMNATTRLSIKVASCREYATNMPQDPLCQRIFRVSPDRYLRGNKGDGSLCCVRYMFPRLRFGLLKWRYPNKVSRQITRGCESPTLANLTSQVGRVETHRPCPRRPHSTSPKKTYPTLFQGRGHPCSRLAIEAAHNSRLDPILQPQAGDVSKIRRVVGDEREVVRQSHGTDH